MNYAYPNIFGFYLKKPVVWNVAQEVQIYLW